MLKPTSACEVCKKQFYASPGHLKKGWAKTCSFECRSKLKKNGRYIENNVACKCCGSIFHIKPSQTKNGKGKVYCSIECKIKFTRITKLCPQCKNEFTIPKSHINRVKYCSKQCSHNASLCSINNCKCKTCDKEFYTKSSDLNRGNNAGNFCSVECMTGSRGKNKMEDGKYASYLELEMLLQLKAYGFHNGMVREYKFHPTRRWLLDFAWPDNKIGIEVHGAIWSGKSGGHTSGKGRLRDMEKLNEAKILGWTIIEVASEHLKTGQAIQWIAKMLAN